MKHIFGNLKKYWYLVMLIIGLLLVQAFCDLSLPDYTSNIIDVGISGYGIEHTTPEYLSETGYQEVSVFLNEEELADWTDAYELNEDKGYYELKDTSEESWDAMDDEFTSIVAITYMLNEQQSQASEGTESNSADSQTAMLEKMQEYGIDPTSPTLMQDLREVLEDKLDDLGDTMIDSMAKYFVKAEYEACDIDLDAMQTAYLWKSGGRMLAMALLMGICAIAIGYLASIVAAGVGRDLRGKVFKKVMNFSDAELDKFSTASLITRSTNDVQQIQQVTVILLRIVLYAPILAIGGLINIRKYNSGMGWVIVLAIAIIIALIAFLMAVAMPKFKIMQDLIDRVNLVSREILTGLPVIRAFSREKREEERFEEANQNLTNVMLFTNRTMAFMSPILTVLMNGISILIVWVAAHKIEEGTLAVGAMTAFITYSMLIIMGFLMLSIVSIMLPRAGVAADRIQEVLDTQAIITDKQDAISEVKKDASVRFENVSFMYADGEENVLEGIDFEAKPGQTTAIIGSTGAGKSTLVKLIPRFFDVTEGRIMVGGVDVRDMSIETLRKQIGYVPQKGILFSGDIKSNIGYGLENLSMETIKEAAEIAQATEFIEEKRDQYDSAISQGGNNVSGGQKQRLSIARAIARNPKIYIFDDSFSALDFKTDTKLRKALEPKIKDATVLIVAQRVSTILNADQIIVLEDGKMIGKGTHKELVENCESYRQIAQSQLSEAEFEASIKGKEEC